MLRDSLGFPSILALLDCVRRDGVVARASVGGARSCSRTGVVSAHKLVRQSV